MNEYKKKEIEESIINTYFLFHIILYRSSSFFHHKCVYICVV